MNAISIKGNSSAEIHQSLETTMKDGFIPTLAMVFISIKQDRDSICELLSRNNIAIYGTTTNGEITDDEISSGAISILLLDLDPSYFSIHFEEFTNPNDASQKIARQAKKKFSNPVFLIACSDFTANYTALLNGFVSVAGEHVEVYGGVAGDDLMNREFFVFTHGKSSNRGIVSVALDADKVLVKGKVISGWKSIGTIKIITKSEGNRIYEIDNKPAVEIITKYAGISETPKDSTEASILISRTLSMNFLKEKGDPVTLMGLVHPEDGSITVHGESPTGTRLQFAVPPDFDIVDKMVDECSDLKKELTHIDASIVFSCSGRMDVLGPMVKEEIIGINNLWDAPLAGFFCNGEIGRPKGGSLEIHNLTVCCVALMEK